jgi:hypothetical protein
MDIAAEGGTSEFKTGCALQWGGTSSAEQY